MGSLLPDMLIAGSGRARAFSFLDDLAEMGCTAFDLAASYMLGGTERLFGGWMASRANRGRLYLISKGGHPYPVVGQHRLGPRALTADLHASLARLRVERLDLYLLHKDDETEPLGSILETMTAFAQQGRVAAWGVSNWSHERIRDLAALAGAGGVSGPSASSPHFSLFAWNDAPWPGSVSIAGDAGATARAYHERTRLPVLAWSPLGGGFVSSRNGTRAGRQQAYATPQNEARRERAETLATKHGRTAAQVALAYLYHHPFQVHAVVAARSTAHMRSNLEATTLRLSVDEVRWLETGEGTLPA